MFVEHNLRDYVVGWEWGRSENEVGVRKKMQNVVKARAQSSSSLKQTFQKELERSIPKQERSEGI